MPNLLSMISAASSSREHRYGKIPICRAGLVDFAARPIDFEFGDRRAGGTAPAEDVLAAALGMPKNLVTFCFTGKNELADGKRRHRLRAARLQPSLDGVSIAMASDKSGKCCHSAIPQMAISASVIR